MEKATYSQHETEVVNTFTAALWFLNENYLSNQNKYVGWDLIISLFVDCIVNN